MLVCALLKVEYVYSIPMEILNSSVNVLQSQMLLGILLLMSDPQVGKPDMGLITLTPVRKPLQYNYFPICGSPTQQVWDLLMQQNHNPHPHLLMASFSFGVVYLFW